MKKVIFLLSVILLTIALTSCHNSHEANPVDAVVAQPQSTPPETGSSVQQEEAVAPTPEPTPAPSQDNIDSEALTLEQMRRDPMSFTGQISVLGVVSEEFEWDFSLSDEDVDFSLNIDYRGSQALPEIGAVIVVTGQMNYRPCCGPHLIATRFEVIS